MDLGNHATFAERAGRYDGRSVGELLTEIRAEVRGRNSSQVREWIAIVAWADQNTVTTSEGAATIRDGVIDTGVPIAGDGAPLVSEFDLMELVAVLGRSPDGGRMYVGQVIECAWRLPGVYAAVVQGSLEPWRAQRIAALTHGLNREAAGFVDRQLAAVGGVGWTQLERLVNEAVIRFDPDKAEEERRKAADRRRFNLNEVDSHGLIQVDGLMDAADGHDLNQAIARRATLLGRLGDESSLDVRRSKAAAELARQDLALDLLVPDPETGEVVATVPGRRIVLNVHVTDTSLTHLTALTGDAGPFQHHGPGSRDGRCATSSTSSDTGDGQGWGSRDGRCATSSTSSKANPVGRWDEGRCPVSVGQIKEWLQARGTSVVVRPVIDLNECVQVDAYEIPDRIRTRVELRDPHCCFPGCTARASRCDLDHNQPYHQGGATCPCNLNPKCRRHHRAKTFSLWRCVIVQPGHYLWISPHGQHFLVSPDGTRALDPPSRVDPDDPDDY